MKYESCKDYFIHGNTVKLSWSGHEHLRRFKITGGKVPMFFEGTKGKREYAKDAYHLWSKTFNFPNVELASPEERIMKEKNHQFENNIREYLKKDLSISFSGYSINTKDIYHWDEIFGGVPDGEEFQGNEVKSVLEIKRNTNSEKPEDLLLSYILQLSLYLCLRNLDTGYICIFTPSNQQEKDNPQNIVFKPSLVQQSISFTKQSINLNSKHLEISHMEYPFEILEKWNNGGQLILYKVKIDSTKYRFIMESMINWHTKYSKTSPQMSEGQVQSLLLGGPKKQKQ